MTEQAHTLPLSRRHRRWIHSFIFGGVIFLCGMVVGGALMLHVVWNRVQHNLQNHEVLAETIARRIERKLDLNDTQAERLRAILEERGQALSDIRRSVRPEVDRELELLRKQVAAILDEEQAADWNGRFERLYDALMPRRQESEPAP